MHDDVPDDDEKDGSQDGQAQTITDHGRTRRERMENARKDMFYPAWNSLMASIRRSWNRADEKALVKHVPQSNERIKAERRLRSYEDAKLACVEEVNSIVRRCEKLNEKYKDHDFDLDDEDCWWGLGMIQPITCANGSKRVGAIFTKPLFEMNGAIEGDVLQGNVGDCWFLAALSALSARRDLWEQVCPREARDQDAGVYGFLFHRDGNWFHVIIDDRLYLRSSRSHEPPLKGGDSLLYARVRSETETWLPLLEKAYAKAHGDYQALDGGYLEEGVEDLTGGVSRTLYSENTKDKNQLWKVLKQLNSKYLAGCSGQVSQCSFGSSHAFTVLKIWEEPITAADKNANEHTHDIGSDHIGDKPVRNAENPRLRLLKIRNPWGKVESREELWSGAWSNDSPEWTPEMMSKLGHKFGNNGVFWISFEDFVEKFTAICLTRLFEGEWMISQAWTCTYCPSFAEDPLVRVDIRVLEDSPSAVFVLFQPDSRYFRGLKGRYDFGLHFDLYDSDNTLLLRDNESLTDLDHTRSVSVEMEPIKAGNYYALVRITTTIATNHDYTETHEIRKTFATAIRQACTSRRSKLLKTGKNFIAAHAKANLSQFEDCVWKARIKHERREIARQKRREAVQLHKSQQQEQSEGMANTEDVDSDDEEVILHAELDDWAAICSLGFRVYTQGRAVQIVCSDHAPGASSRDIDFDERDQAWTCIFKGLAASGENDKPIETDASNEGKTEIEVAEEIVTKDDTATHDNMEEKAPEKHAESADHPYVGDPCWV